MALSFSIEVIHIRCRTRSHELDSPHAVHVCTTVVIRIFIAELVCKPVAVGVGEVTVYTIGTIGCRAVIDRLTTGREDELSIGRFRIAIEAPWGVSFTTGTIAGVIALVVHDNGVGLTVLGFRIVATDDDRITGKTIRHGLHLDEIDLTVSGALGGNLSESGIDSDGIELCFGSCPIVVIVGLFVRNRNDSRGVDGETEGTCEVIIDDTGSLVETGRKFSVRCEDDVIRCAGCHFARGNNGIECNSFVGCEFHFYIGGNGSLVGIGYADGNRRTGCEHPVVRDGHGEGERFEVGRVDKKHLGQGIVATADDDTACLQFSKHGGGDGIVIIATADECQRSIHQFRPTDSLFELQLRIGTYSRELHAKQLSFYCACELGSFNSLPCTPVGRHLDGATPDRLGSTGRHSGMGKGDLVRRITGTFDDERFTSIYRIQHSLRQRNNRFMRCSLT